MSFLYPRTISIRRQTSGETTAGAISVGLQSYQAKVSAEAVAAEETTIATGIPANIQPKSDGRAGGKNTVPANESGPAVWKIFIPKRSLAKGVLRDLDVVVDDEGYRYQVTAAYWNSMGYAAAGVRLET